jgi:hypothetical protein
MLITFPTLFKKQLLWSSSPTNIRKAHRGQYIAYGSDSQSLLRGPLVVREIRWSGPRMPIQINILHFADHQIIICGPHTEKVWEPLL